MELWDVEKNTDLDPAELSSLSHKKAWWKCGNCGHEWESQIKNRMLSEGSCPKCRKRSNKRVPVSKVPDLMKYWGDNPGLDPEDFNSYATDVVNWKCPDCGYEWKSQISSRMASSSECPACSGLIATEKRNVLISFPELQKYYDVEAPDNPALEKLLPNARDKIHWKCPDCGYKWEQPLHERIRRHGGLHRVANCPVCAGVAVKGVNTDLVKEYPSVAEEWNSEKNGKLPDGIRAKSTANYWWQCKEGHDYYMSVSQRIDYYQSGKEACPYCDDRAVMPGFNSFAAKHPKLLREWDFVNNYPIADPDEISDMNDTSVWWLCHNNSTHKYMMTPRMRILMEERGREPCTICKGRRRKQIHFVKE